MDSKTELLRTQSGMTTDANETNADKERFTELIKVKHMEGTPFTIVTAENGKAFVALGNARVSDYATMEECESKVIEREWDFMINVISRIAQLTIDNNQK